MFARFLQLQPARQLLVAGGLLLLLVLAYFRGLWLPMADALRAKRQQYDAALQEQRLVSDYATEIRALQATGQASDPAAVGNLTGLVNTTLQARGLELVRIQQLSPGQVSIRLENVDFAGVVAWLYELESTPGVMVGEVGIRPTAGPDPRRVDVTVGLGQQQ